MKKSLVALLPNFVTLAYDHLHQIPYLLQDFLLRASLFYHHLLSKSHKMRIRGFG
ncbi:MAG: hypothetical protein OXC40_01275 [Proteobacteria bacterium]|nr:hypothetical protein [Pseudomonadota bacterium]